MIVTEGVRDTFRKRSKVMSTIRHMLEQQDFLEIETPVLESTAGLSSLDDHSLASLALPMWHDCSRYFVSGSRVPVNMLLTVRQNTNLGWLCSAYCAIALVPMRFARVGAVLGCT